LSRHDQESDQQLAGAVGGDPGRSVIEELLLKTRALDASAEGITIADARLPDQPLIYVNEGFTQLTGYSAEDVLGRNCRFLQGDSTDEESIAEIRRAVDEGRSCMVEILNHRKDGKPFWNRLSINPVIDDSGAVTHYIGVQSDITARKEAETALIDSNQALATVNRRIRRDLEMAARIQQGFLPDKDLEIPGLELAWEMRSCDELAGDTLNVVPLDERHVEFYSIDVSGHGVPAALLSVTLNHVLLPAAERFALSGPGGGAPDAKLHLDPSAVAERLNRRFPFNTERNQFFTLVYGIYDRSERSFRFVSAGHPSPILVSHDGTSRRDWQEGIPIGVLPGTRYAANSVELSLGDRLYLYTDGLIEAQDPHEEPFGMERLEATLAGQRGNSLQDSIDETLAAVDRWSRGARFEDDLSILAFEVSE